MQRIQLRFREDTAQNWKIANPILASSEPARETDTGKIKIGDGITAWNNLSYLQTAGGSDVVIDNTVTVDNTEVLNAISANKTESDNKLDLINNKLDNITNVDTKLDELKTLIENIEVSGGGSADIDSILAEQGYCMVTYANCPIYDGFGEVISEHRTEIAKIGSTPNFNIWAKKQSNSIYYKYYFMGYSKDANENNYHRKLELTIDGKCVLYPVYFEWNEEFPYTTVYGTLDTYLFNQNKIIDFGLGTPIYNDDITGKNPIIIGYSNDKDSIVPTKDLAYSEAYAIIKTKDDRIWSCKDYTENSGYITKKYGPGSTYEAPFTYINSSHVVETKTYKLYEMLKGVDSFDIGRNAYRFKGWTNAPDSTRIIDLHYDYMAYQLWGDEIEYKFYAVYEEENQDTFDTRIINATEFNQ